MSDRISQEPANQFGGVGKNSWTVGAAAGVIALASFGAYHYAETRDLRAQMATSQSEIQALRQTLATRDSAFEAKFTQMLRRVEAAKEEASSSALGRAQAAADSQTRALAAKMERQQQAATAKVDAELKRMEADSERHMSGMKTAVEDVKTEVAGVRTGLDAVNEGVQRGDVELTRVRGDLGVMSGLIATNSKEIAALRELGDRTIYEFSLAKNGQLQRVGDIRVKVKKTDAKRNRYTMEILADDKLVEKKDRTTNEPVQFYVTSRARQPYELVVNEVGNGQLKGYLAVPKVTRAHN